MAETPRGQFLTHVLPAWISALCALAALVIALYTLLVVTRTSSNVVDIMHAMSAAPLQKP